MDASATPRRLDRLSEISGSFRAVLCDIWGVVHDGITPFPKAVDALRACRRAGGIVMLITNAPRPRDSVVEQLDEIGVDRDSYDDLVTSGDVARATLGERSGARIYHLGPDRDLSIYDDLEIELTELNRAEIVSCTGLFDDETEIAADYDPTFAEMKRRGLTMICSNPDLVVERGDRLIPCAGAMAARYRERGGEAVVVGKPYAPIYDQALARIRERAGSDVTAADVLAIGDGAATDISGAGQAGMPALFISSGMRATARDAAVDDAGEVAAFLASHKATARYFMPRLR